jgi:GT2 family glycosyltransferase
MNASPTWRVSAIIPSYNRADFLGETIACLIAQNEPVYEIIVVDDGSKDATAEVVAGFGDRVRYRRIENSGAPVARNIGAEMATGDWLWFCDSDDLWKPNFLASVRTIAGTPPHPPFLFGNFRRVRDGIWEPESKFETAPKSFWENIPSRKVPGGTILLEPLFRHILSFQPVFPSTIVMRKSLFDAVGGFDVKFARTASEDFEFTLRCVAHAPIGVVDEALVGVRRHGGNFSANQLANLLGEVRILNHARHHHAAAAQFAEEVDADIRRRNVQALGLAFSEGRYTLVRSLADDIGRPNLDDRSRLKVLLASCPEAVRTSLLALIRWIRPDERVRKNEKPG